MGSWSGPFAAAGEGDPLGLRRGLSSAGKSGLGRQRLGRSPPLGRRLQVAGKKKATDALMGAATSAANSVARIFAKQVTRRAEGAATEGSVL